MSALVPVTPTLSDLQEWQDVAKVREDKIRELESIIENLRHDNRILSVRCFYIQGNHADISIANCSLERCRFRNRNLQGAN
jgi:uncharacterized protein YjbI with pentapeptide repeats